MKFKKGDYVKVIKKGKCNGRKPSGTCYGYDCLFLNRIGIIVGYGDYDGYDVTFPFKEQTLNTYFHCTGFTEDALRKSNKKAYNQQIVENEI